MYIALADRKEQRDRSLIIKNLAHDVEEFYYIRERAARLTIKLNKRHRVRIL